jgi:5-methylcytosine-specific restriction endonuclease McrA
MRMAQTTEEQRQKNNAKARKYQQKNKEVIRKRRMDAYAANPDKYKKQTKKSYVLHQDRSRATARAYYHAHRIERLKAQKSYRERNVETFRLRNLLWKQTHPHEVQAHNARRRARLANAVINDLTHQQWLTIQASQDHRCYYCHKRRKGRLTQDHIIALSKGGNHTISNVIGACRECNSRKGVGGPPIPVQPWML